MCVCLSVCLTVHVLGQLPNDDTLSVTITACAAYGDEFRTSAKNVAAALTVVVAAGLACMILYLSYSQSLAIKYTRLGVRELLVSLPTRPPSRVFVSPPHIVQAREKSHQRVVNYVLHNLRNPLHVLETWSLAFVRDGLELTQQDRELASADMRTALARVHGMMRDIAAYKEFVGGHYSFKPSPTSPRHGIDSTLRVIASIVAPTGGVVRANVPPASLPYVSRARARACVCVCVYCGSLMLLLRSWLTNLLFCVCTWLASPL